MLLEDESGRIRLVGERVRSAGLVTGVIIAALGMENPTGDFDVVDICEAGMAPDANTSVNKSNIDYGTRMDVDGTSLTTADDAFSDDDSHMVEVDSASDSSDVWVAVISGLHIGAPCPSDIQIQMLVEYLAGEAGGEEEQLSTSQISRLIIAGDSLATMPDNEPTFAERRAVSSHLILFILFHLRVDSMCPR